MQRSPAPEVAALLSRAAGAGSAPLSDQLSEDLRHGAGVTIPARGAHGLVGVAQVSPRAGAWTMQLVIDPDHRRDRAIGENLVALAVATVAAQGGGRVDWWVFDASPDDDELAHDVGFTVGRDLHQMRRSLPAPWSATVPTRAFRPGHDEEAWLAVNNRAFAGHPEQSAWTIADLRSRVAEPWFDPAGFRLHEQDGQLAGFCWTKLHGPAGDPHSGEIYVIGVDPAYQKRGLGRELTLAGLDSISARGVGEALLYVDAANAAAMALYTRLGFGVARTDRAYVATVAADSSS